MMLLTAAVFLTAAVGVLGSNFQAESRVLGNSASEEVSVYPLLHRPTQLLYRHFGMIWE
jgi:hypothetical protein